MTPEERKAAADKMRAEIAADRAKPRAHQDDSEPAVTKSTTQNRQSPNPQGTPPPSTGVADRSASLVQRGVNAMQSEASRMQQALDVIKTNNR